MNEPMPGMARVYIVGGVSGATITVVQTSTLRAPASDVWARAASPEGIKRELRPWMRMTVPRALRGMTIDDAPLGEVAGRSWILLLGFLPVEYDDIRLIELDPGRRFLERSEMLTLRPWQHERIVEPIDDGSCRITDRLSLELRPPPRSIPGAGAIPRRIVTALFAHRHRRLRRACEQ